MLWNKLFHDVDEEEEEEGEEDHLHTSPLNFPALLLYFILY